MRKITGTFQSTSGLCDIHFYFYVPEKPRALVMLAHGMCEYIERYEEFAEFLCANDIVLCGIDNLGHGRSVTDRDMLGYFGHSRGYINMVRDLHRMKLIAERKFPDIPHFLLGHSMGSFLARIFLSKYRHRWSGCIFMGTAGGAVGSAPLRRVLELMARNHGERYRHTLGTSLAFGLFNLRTENYRTQNDWLSRDDAEVDKFNADPLCNFIFTVAGYRDMLNALLCCNSAAVVENTPRDVPLLFMSGGMDPVGEYGHGVSKAAHMYMHNGCDVRLRIYREARHELLHELNRSEVMEDILAFLNPRI